MAKITKGIPTGNQICQAVTVDIACLHAAIVGEIHGRIAEREVAVAVADDRGTGNRTGEVRLAIAVEITDGKTDQSVLRAAVEMRIVIGCAREELRGVRGGWIASRLPDIEPLRRVWTIAVTDHCGGVCEEFTLSIAVQVGVTQCFINVERWYDVEWTKDVIRIGQQVETFVCRIIEQHIYTGEEAAISVAGPLSVGDSVGEVRMAIAVKIAGRDLLSVRAAAGIGRLRWENRGRELKEAVAKAERLVVSRYYAQASEALPREV